MGRREWKGCLVRFRRYGFGCGFGKCWVADFEFFIDGFV